MRSLFGALKLTHAKSTIVYIFFNVKYLSSVPKLLEPVLVQLYQERLVHIKLEKSVGNLTVCLVLQCCLVECSRLPRKRMA